MADIVERAKSYIPGEPAHVEAVPEVLDLLCAEIERLRAQVERAQDLSVAASSGQSFTNSARKAEMDDRLDKVMKAICQESCAYYGEPACWKLPKDIYDVEWPNKLCDEPGCMALAQAAIAALISEDGGRE